MRETAGQKGKVARVMHAFKEDELRAANGAKVRGKKQAVAIALHEAGVSRGPQAADAPSHAALMKAARAANIPGRTRMTHEQLQRALKGKGN